MSQTVSAMMLDLSRQDPNKIAYYKKDQGRFVSVSRKEFQADIQGLGAWMRAHGVNVGDKISVYSQTNPQWFTADVASFSFGAIAVGIYDNLLEDVVEYILNHSESKGIFLDNETQLERVLAVKDQCPGLKWVVTFQPSDKVDNKFVFHWDTVLAEGKKLDEQAPGEFEKLVHAVKPEDIFTLVYTSGTTGMPKGVVLTHEAMMFVIKGSVQIIDISDKDVSVCFLPLSHILQRMVTYLGAYTSSVGYFTTIKEVIEDLKVIKPTIMASVPRIFEKAHFKVVEGVKASSPIKQRIFQMAMDLGRQRSALLQAGKPVPGWMDALWNFYDKLVFQKVKANFGGRVRFFTSGGAPISQELMKFFHAMGILITEGYGLSETSAPATVNTPDAYRFGTVGKPLPGVEIKIAEDGEILIRGKGNLREYYKNPEATAEAIDKDGWFHSGDVGEFDKDGFLKITDRKKDLIITSAGKNIAPQNLENHFKVHPLIGNIMVVGERRNFLTALITLDPDTIGTWAKNQGLGNLSFHEIATHPKLIAAMEEAVKERNKELAKFETIKKFRILEEDFTVENGMITPSLKLKRKVVSERFNEAIESLYGSGD